MTDWARAFCGAFLAWSLFAIRFLPIEQLSPSIDGGSKAMGYDPLRCYLLLTLNPWWSMEYVHLNGFTVWLGP